MKSGNYGATFASDAEPCSGNMEVHSTIVAQSRLNKSRHSKYFVYCLHCCTKPKHLLIQVFANDVDEGRNGRITYTIISGNTHNAFVIHPENTGILKTNVILDREIMDSYRLEVEAVDQGAQAMTSTCILRIQIIDENDNAPFFPSYGDVKVREGECRLMAMYATRQ